MARYAAPVRLVVSLLVLAAACTVEFGAKEGRAKPEDGAGEVLIYTSMYQSVIDAFVALAAEKLPGIKVSFYRAGSEKVSLRLDAELRAGATPADLLMVSDPFYYERLRERGSLLPYVSVHTLRLPRELVDLDGTFAPARISTMAIAYHPAALGSIVPPQSYADLADTRFRGRVVIPDPLTSGTMFTTLAFLVRAHGWDYVASLRRNGIVAAGGNSAVLEKIEAREFAVGLVCLENIVQVRKKGSPIIAVVPDHAVMIPGDIAILRATRHEAQAKRFYDLVMSPEGQRLMAAGEMHSADARQAAAPELPSFQALYAKSAKWSEAFLRDTARDAEAIKHKYQEIMHAR